jgi:hypothetical protein
MAITYKGIAITANSGEYRYRIGWIKCGPFEHRLQDVWTTSRYTSAITGSRPSAN